MAQPVDAVIRPIASLGDKAFSIAGIIMVVRGEKVLMLSGGGSTAPT